MKDTKSLHQVSERWGAVPVRLGRDGKLRLAPNCEVAEFFEYESGAIGHAKQLCTKELGSPVAVFRVVHFVKARAVEFDVVIVDDREAHPPA